MEVKGKHYRTVWMEGNDVLMINQHKLPFAFEIYRSKTYQETAEAIRNMMVRGAGAIGAAAGYAMAQAYAEAGESCDAVFVSDARAFIEATRPTAQNLFYATDRVMKGASNTKNPVITAREIAEEIANEDAKACKAIGISGDTLINKNARILTHCNAGWLAFVDYGSALAPVYEAQRQGKNPYVYADETRPRSQGARLTAWELNAAGIRHHIIADNAAALLMSTGKVDLVITGADRIAANGDTANKIGTLEKAIAAHYFGIPFYVAAPRSTFDMDCPEGTAIIIESRSEEEVHFMDGMDDGGHLQSFRVTSPGSPALNPAFDVTPASLISGFITDKGVLDATPEAIAAYCR